MAAWIRLPSGALLNLDTVTEVRPVKGVPDYAPEGTIRTVITCFVGGTYEGSPWRPHYDLDADAIVEHILGHGCADWSCPESLAALREDAEARR